MGDEFSREKLHLFSQGVLSYSDVAPFLDELGHRHMFVDATVTEHEPPAFGFSEIALTLIVANTAVPYLRAFFSTWGEEDARQLRAELLTLLERGRCSKSGRKYMPMTVHLVRADNIDHLPIPTRVRFNFHRPLTEEEFLEQIRAAQSYVDSLPDEAFEGSGGPYENSLFWDDNVQSWRGVVTGFREDERYFPPDLLA